MKEEDVLNEIASATTILLLDAAKDAMSIILDEIKSVCMVYNVEFPNLVEGHENVAIESPERKDKHFLSDPPYNVRTNAFGTTFRMTSSCVRT